MPLFTFTNEQAAILREIVKSWATIKPRLSTLLADADPTIDETPAQKLPRGVTPNPDGSYWFEIQSASVVAANQWNYKGRVMKSGDTSSLTGLVKTVDTTQFDLRNANEAVALGGLTGISSLLAIANNSVVRAWPEFRNNVRVFVFERPNDIVCNLSSVPTIITSDTELMAGETLALVDASGGPVTITLAPVSDADVPGTIVTVKKVDSSANAVTVVPAGAEMIDGASSYVLSVQYAYVAAVPDDTDYYVTSQS